jgi:hypothetical protein
MRGWHGLPTKHLKNVDARMNERKGKEERKKLTRVKGNGKKQ